MRSTRGRALWLWIVYVAMVAVLAVAAIRDGEWWLVTIGAALGLLSIVGEGWYQRRQRTRRP